MKNNRLSFYLSSNSLKASIKYTASSDPSYYLKSIMGGKTRPISQARVLPLVNLYPGLKSININEDQTNKFEDTGLNENGWYHNYE